MRSCASAGMAAAAARSSAELNEPRRMLPEMPMREIMPADRDPRGDYATVCTSFTVNQPERVASAGNTRSDVEISTEANRAEPVAAQSPWADDHNFIAPAQ